MKGFRNRLAHQYGNIDDEIAFNNIVNGIGDFEEFLSEIEENLDKQPG